MKCACILVYHTICHTVKCALLYDKLQVNVIHIIISVSSIWVKYVNYVFIFHLDVIIPLL